MHRTAKKKDKSILQKYWTGLSWSVFAVIAKAILGIGASVVFVRYLGDTGYGQVVVMADFVTMGIVLLSQGLGVVQTRAIPQLMVKKEYGQVKDFIYKVFAYRWAMSAIAAYVLYINLDFIHSHFFSGVSPDLILIALILIPIQMIGVCFRGVLEVTYHQKFVSLADISLLMFRILIVIPVIYYDLGVVWFFITQAIAHSFALIIYGYAFCKRVWSFVKKAPRVAFQGKIWSTGAVMMLILLSGKFLGKEMDTQILSFRLGSEALPEIALYSVSFTLVFRSLSFVGFGSGSVANLTQAAMSELKETNKINEIRSLYESQICLFYFIITPLIFGGSLLADRMLNLMYGEIFYGKGLVCSILFMVLGGSIINGLNYFVLFSFSRERFLLINRLLWGCANVILSYIFAVHGAIGVTIATGVCLFATGVIETYYVHLLLHPRFPLKSLGKIVVGAMTMSLFVTGLLNILAEFNEFYSLIGAVMLGAGIYAFSMMILKPLRGSNTCAVPSVAGIGLIVKVIQWF